MNTLNGWGIFSVIAIIIFVIWIICFYNELKKKKINKEKINKDLSLLSKIMLWYLLASASLIVFWQIMNLKMLILNNWGIGSIILIPIFIILIIFTYKELKEERKAEEEDTEVSIVVITIMSVGLIIGLTITSWQTISYYKDAKKFNDKVLTDTKSDIKNHLIDPWRIKLNYNSLKDSSLKQDTVTITCQKQKKDLILKMKFLGYTNFQKSVSSKKFNITLNPEDLARYAKSIIRNQKSYQKPKFVEQAQNFLLKKGINDSLFLSLNSELRDPLYNLINKDDSLRQIDSIDLMQEKVNQFISLKINRTKQIFKDTLIKTKFLSNLKSFMFAQTSQDSALLIKLKQQILKQLEDFWQKANSVAPDTIIDYQDFYRNSRLQHGITDSELAQLLKGLKIKNKEVSLMIFDSTFDLPASTFLVDLIDYESNYKHEKMFLANLVFSALDVNTDGTINIRDDVTNNSVIDAEDFKMFFGIQTDISTKYGEDFQQEQIVINDLLFLKSKDLSGKKAIRGTVDYTGFKPFFEKTVNYLDLDYNTWKEQTGNKIVQEQGTYYQTGFLGFVTGYKPGEIKSIPIYSDKTQKVYLEKTYVYTEILGPVEVAAFQIEKLNNNYIVFFFDASEVATKIIEQEITQNYLNNNKASSNHRLISVDNTRDMFSQKTSGRVTVLNVDLKLQCSFFKGKFQRVYYLGQENLQQGATNIEKPNKIIAPFQEIYSYIVNSDDFENLGQLTREIKESSSENAINNMNKYLKNRDNPELSYNFLTPCWGPTPEKN